MWNSRMDIMMAVTGINIRILQTTISLSHMTAEMVEPNLVAVSLRVSHHTTVARCFQESTVVANGCQRKQVAPKITREPKASDFTNIPGASSLFSDLQDENSERALQSSGNSLDIEAAQTLQPRPYYDMRECGGHVKQHRLQKMGVTRIHTAELATRCTGVECRITCFIDNM
ncbi:unnamed protein product, partial [Amoebophrya sp. A25]|eukprot:GSA25T00000079001.1